MYTEESKHISIFVFHERKQIKLPWNTIVMIIKEMMQFIKSQLN